MTTNNSYATNADLLAFIPNSTNLVAALVDNALDAASRMIEEEVGEVFYPMIETRYFDTPDDEELDVHGTLLEVITLLNGDGTAIASTDYKLWPYNTFPKASIRLLPLSTTYFNEGTDNWNQAAIALTAVWGYHNLYNQAWLAGTTLGAAVTTTSATSLTVALSTLFAPGNIIKIDSELMLVTATGTGSLTVTRAWNGSTAATHLNGATVYIWQVEADIKRACLIQAHRLYRRNESVYGTIGGGEMGVQPVTIPQLDPDVKKSLDSYKSRLW